MLVILRSIFGCDNKKLGLETFQPNTPPVSDPMSKFIVLKQQTLQFCSRLCFTNTANGGLNHRLLESFVLPLLLQALLLLNIGL